MIQDARGWCTGMTQRDGMGREVGGGVQTGEHMYTRGGFMSMYGKNQYNIVKKKKKQGRGSLVGGHLWGRTESDTTEAT